MRTLRRIVIVLVVVVILLPALFTWAALTFNYSDGERVGVVQKFSRRGWVCKTWEGELAMINYPGAMQETFAFTVRNDAVAQKLNTLIGQRIKLTYEQHKHVPTSCFGETEYFVTDVAPIGPANVGTVSQ